MKKTPIIKTIFGDKTLYSQDLIRTIDYYQTVSDIVERTYIAMGRKKTTQFSTISSTKGKLNVKSIGSTAKI